MQACYQKTLKRRISLSQFQIFRQSGHNATIFFLMMALKFNENIAFTVCLVRVSSPSLASHKCAVFEISSLMLFFVGCVSRHSHQRSLFTASCSWQGSHRASREAVSREHRVTPHHGSCGTHGSWSMLLIFHCLAAAATTAV